MYIRVYVCTHIGFRVQGLVDLVSRLYKRPISKPTQIGALMTPWLAFGTL